MKGERLTDTIQFKHKNITNPTLSHHDKLMHALAKCKETLDGLLMGKTDQQLAATHNNCQQRASMNNNYRFQQGASSEGGAKSSQGEQHQHQAARRGARLQARAKRRPSLAHLTHQVNLPNAPPAKSTRSKVKAAAQT
jgi:hypothetical protein